MSADAIDERLTMAAAVTAVEPPPAGDAAVAPRSRPWWPRYGHVVLSILILAALIGLWQWATTTGRVSKFVMPTPANTVRALWRGFVSDDSYREAFVTTLKEILIGYGVGAGSGVVLGGLLASSRLVERAFYPFVVFLQALPKIAIAPLLIIWFGFGLTSKVVSVALLVAFPVLANTIEGLKAAPRSRIDLLEAYGASRWQVFWQLRVPMAAPHIFTGLDIAIVFSPVGAVVAEFVGASTGLGVAVLQAQLSLDTAGVFALLIVLGVLGVSLHLALVRLRRLVLYWERFERRH